MASSRSRTTPKPSTSSTNSMGPSTSAESAGTIRVLGSTGPCHRPCFPRRTQTSATSIPLGTWANELAWPMRILFTGASSFTGFWFVRELARAGHEIVATFRRPLDAYTDEVRRARVALLAPMCQPVPGVEFGDDSFLALLKGKPGFDILCHHAAEVTNYKSPAFDVSGALATNTRNFAAVTEALAARGCCRLVLTGSVFENDEGAGSEG